MLRTTANVFFARRWVPAQNLSRSFSGLGYGNADETEAVYTDTNFPRAEGGRVLHLDLAPGDVANRILSVGDSSRAKRLSELLDDTTSTKVVKSGRGFVTYTGEFKKVPVSIVATGMGTAMMDFVVRETRAVVEGNMLLVRFGSCGGFRANVPAGQVVVTKDSVLVQRNPDNMGPCADLSQPAYRISRPVSPDGALFNNLLTELGLAVGEDRTITGTNVTCCSFYSSQARVDPAFDDRNEDLLTTIEAAAPDAACMEMETFQLLDLARCSNGSMRSAAAAVVLANRRTDQVLDAETMAMLEATGGRAVLTALTQTAL